VFRNTPRTHPWVNNAEANLIEQADATAPNKPAPGKVSTRELFSRMTPRSIANLLCVNAQTIFSTIADNIYSAWIPLFLIRVHGLEFKEMGIYSALPLLGGAIGGALGGYLNDYFIRKTGNLRFSRTGVGLAGKGGAAVLLFVALAFFYDQPYAFCGMLFFIKLVGDTSLTTTWGAVSDIGGRASASVFAYNNGVASIFSLVAPVMYGYMSQYWGWQAVFITAGLSYLLCSLSWLLIDCTIPVMPEEDHLADRPTEERRVPGSKTPAMVERIVRLMRFRNGFLIGAMLVGGAALLKLMGAVLVGFLPAWLNFGVAVIPLWLTGPLFLILAAATIQMSLKIGELE